MRFRLISSFIVVVLISVIGVVVFARRGATNEVRAFMNSSGTTWTNELAAQLENYYKSYGSWQAVGAQLEHYLNATTGPSRGMGNQGMMKQRLLLADQDGNLIVDTANSYVTGKISRADRQSAIELKVSGATIGYLLLESGAQYNRNQETLLLNRLNRAALTSGLIAGGIAILVALVLAYYLLRPVQALTRATEHMAHGDLSQRVPVRGDDELARLGQSFNRMADSLQQAQESRRAMTADIAHELRNPLAVQRAHLEALQDGIYPPTPENLQPVLDQNLLLTRLVDDLQTLALADGGQLRLERTPTELPLLVKRVVERFAPQSSARQIEIQYETSAQAMPLALIDPMRIEQIMGNLLSNALRHTPDGGRIKVRLTHSTAAALIEVYNSGPGIPVEALPYIFDRFYRADRARSRSEGGSGLGLSIARKLAEAHGGDLTATNSTESGAIFTLTIPFSVLL